MKVSKLVLKGEGLQVPGKPKEEVGSVLVEVDMLDSEKEPSRSQHAKVGRGGTASLSFDRAYEADEKSKLGKAFAKALESTEEEDSEVQLVVYALDKDVKEVELGVARCSLERLVNKGKDHDGVLEVMQKGVVVGELTCSIAAVAALGKGQPAVSPSP